MKVKIGDRWYDAQDEPIMVQLDPEDKENIADMSPQCTKYCSYPEEMDEHDVDRFIETMKPLKLIKRRR